MALKLGKVFIRNYNLRVPFMEGFYNIGVFFDKRSTSLLFSVDSDYSTTKTLYNTKVTMFKNLESSMFCETFLNLHNYRKNTLDISNQFKEIKPEYTGTISFLINETITLSKVELHDREVFDTVNFYGLTINSHYSEFLFLIAERHFIDKKLGRKIVRTTGLQISSSNAISVLEDYNEESKTSGKAGKDPFIEEPKEIIKID
jgi:hypothetical protein